MKASMKIAVIGVAAVLLPACSTIVNGSNQSVAFNTGDVTGAVCNLTGGSDFAVREKFKTPSTVKIPRSKKALDLECSKEGYKDASKKVYSKIEETVGGNLILGGVVGGAVDAATGALYRYPDTVVLLMEPAE